MRITRTKNKVPIRRIAKVVVIAIFKAPTQEVEQSRDRATHFSSNTNSNQPQPSLKALFRLETLAVFMSGEPAFVRC
jgi:hypothetical protein